MNRIRKVILTLLGLVVLAGQGFPTQAQGTATARLFLVDSQAFPVVEALLDVFDSQGQFVTGLDPEAVTVIENGVTLPVVSLKESNPPVQIVVAVNPGPSLAVRNAQGISRFQFVVDALSAWAQAQPEEDHDDLSLVTIAGALITRANPADWIVSLTSFQPNFRSTTPNLQSLTIALDAVSAPTPQPGMKRAVLFITPTMEGDLIEADLNLLAERAQAQGVRIFVWLVDAEMNFDEPGATAFQVLAQNTGGSYFAFSGLQELPDPESYFAPLRNLYSLRYTSAIRESGEHNVMIQVELQDGQVTSEEGSFDVELNPPNTLLIAPPAQIVRQAPEEDPFNAENILPNQQPVEIIIEFPDGITRQLATTTLYVDGQPVARNEAEPFEKFTWDLSPYGLSGSHELYVETIDSFGLTSTSNSATVTITVIQPPTGWQAILAQYRTTITIGAMILTGVILVAILLYGRVRIRTLRQRRADRKRYSDPVTQPVSIRQAEPPGARKKDRKGKQARGPRWIQRSRQTDAPAYLVRLRADGEPSTGSAIPLSEKEITFGNDPIQAMHVLDDPSVSALHARIRRTETENFLLSDNQSAAGTWVNYEPVPREGIQLKHGDVVHFGQLMYRFKLRKPPVVPEPKIEIKLPDK